MKNGKVELYIHETLDSKGAMIFSLIDPVDYPSVDKAVETAKEVVRGGVDIILLGGSIGVQGELLDNTAKRIKEEIDAPLILFPGNIATITRHADAIYFMSLLNSKSIDFLMRHQVTAAVPLRKMKIETIPMGYIIVEPGMTVGRVGQADLVRRDDATSAVSYAVAAQMFGMSLVYLEAGSGSPEHVPGSIIRRVKESLDIPLIVGGGIRTPEASAEVARAGADVIVTGTVAERAQDVYSTLEPIIRAAKL
jgi:phosphoglycerol geranylgeranyltransferase